jgi:hypothetical protein
MKFEQQMAGNAEERHASHLEAPVVPFCQHMALRPPIPVLLVALCALVLTAAPARASDPLLSGYGGPGSGEQVLLGGGTVGGGGASSGAGQSLRATTPATAVAQAPATSSDTGATVTRKPSQSSSSSSKSGHAMNGPTTSSGSSAKAPGSSSATPPGAPRAVAYPTRAGDVGGLPLSLVQALLVVLGAAALILAIIGLRRLSERSDDLPPTAQARGAEADHTG